jgi:predicted nucleic acid-binding protein
MLFVIDASIALGWCFPDEASDLTRHVLQSLLESRGIIPAIFYFEVANVLSLAERHGRITAVEAEKFVSLVDNLKLFVDRQGTHRAWHEVRRLANAEQLTVYDAAYLELAIRMQATLSTKDEQLRAACSRHQVPIVMA